MAEETWLQTIIDWAAKNANMKGQFGANIWQGQSNISRDLTDQCPFLDFTQMPYGRDVLGANMGAGLFKMESWDAVSPSKAAKRYQIAYEELSKAQIRGDTFCVGVHCYQQPEDSPGWENKCFRRVGLFFVNWYKRT